MAEAWAAETPGKLALTASGAFYAAGAETTGNLAITAPDVFHGTAAETPEKPQ